MSISIFIYIIYDLFTIFIFTIVAKKSKEKTHSFECVFVETGIYISSQAVSSQVLSAQLSLTSVFGMRTGGTSASSTPVIVEGLCTNVHRTFTTA